MEDQQFDPNDLTGEDSEGGASTVAAAEAFNNHHKASTDTAGRRYSRWLTVVLGRMPPEASVAVPVMPPRVCCAGAGKERTNWKQQQRKEEKKTDNVVFLLLIIRNGLLNSSRYTWPIKASQDFLGTAIC